jgi:hypothetical protein
MALPEPVAYTQFVGESSMRPVYEEFICCKWRQHVLDDDGEPVFGIWYIPPEEWS